MKIPESQQPQLPVKLSETTMKCRSKPMELIEKLAEQKTKWLKDFKETYQANREEKKRIYKLDRLK